MVLVGSNLRMVQLLKPGHESRKADAATVERRGLAAEPGELRSDSDGRTAGDWQRSPAGPAVIVGARAPRRRGQRPKRSAPAPGRRSPVVKIRVPKPALPGGSIAARPTAVDAGRPKCHRPRPDS